MQRKHRLRISGDYDSCFDILFEELHLTHPDLQDEEGKAAAQIAKDTLVNYLAKKTAGYDKVYYYVGSNRQSRALNSNYMNNHKNGCCFKNSIKLCNEKGWKFRPLLLADTQNDNQPAGTAMRDPSLQATIAATKLEIILGQLADMKKNHPNDIVDFIFFDDDTDDKIIPDIQNYFANNPLPKHINKLTLVRYDWFETVGKNLPSIMKEINITQPSKAIKLGLNNKKISSSNTIKEIPKEKITEKRKFEEENVAPTFFEPINKKHKQHNIKPEENMHQIIKTGTTYKWT